MTMGSREATHEQLLPLQFRCGPAVLLALVFLAWPAQAASIYFGMSLTGNTLTLTNQGDTTAFYPAVLHLLHDGRWEALALPAGLTQPAELLPGATLDWVWPTASPQQQAFPLEVFQPVMVRFFDSAGTGFGQISFFMQPPAAATLLEAHYDNGLMTLEPPPADGNDAIHATWLLWPQEEGIAPLFGAIAFEHRQPPAQRIEWRAGMAPLQFDLGAGLPAVMLVHETSNGFTLQSVAGGGLQGVQQRSAWLNARAILFTFAGGIAAAASMLLLWFVARTWRARKKP
jgi:hypothetical protein